jgi:aldose 1-epimerase
MSNELVATHETFFELPEGGAKLYKLRNSKGFGADITDFGGTVISLYVPDRDGNLRDVVLGYSNPVEYMTNKFYFGALVGRYANRIANASFTLDGKDYHLPQNSGANCLHGGINGFHRQLWESELEHTEEGPALRLKYFSADGEEGFPGNLQVEVVYTVTESNELKIDYYAETEAPTVVNFTNHSYFNLNGAGNGLIDTHYARIKADSHTEASDDCIPTGRILPVDGTAFDLREGALLRDRFTELPHGYDNNFVLAAVPSEPAAEIWSEQSGIKLEMFTTEPGMQFYTAYFLDESTVGKNDKPHPRFGGLCLEAQHYPNSPNQPEFPSTVLRPGEKYKQTTVYKFSLLEC